ncbi:MAG: hypothetical protein ACRERC_06140 [Candidatus Binatia bacterium]
MAVRRGLVALAIGLALGRAAGAVEYRGIEFPQGSASFADAVISYDPYFHGGPAPTDPKFTNPTAALGVPDFAGGFDGTGAVAIGRGGLLALRFTDNVVINSGNGQTDLAVFEVGQDETYFVALRPANQTTRNALTAVGCPVTSQFCPLGGSYNGQSEIDIDASFPGFGAGQLRFDGVRILDDWDTGHNHGDQVGPDIDAVGGMQAGSIVCGDGRVEGNETCDDAALIGGDGCAGNCRVETCWICSGEPSACQIAPGAACEDGEPCTAGDTCNAGALCVPGPPPSCSDANVCTNDVCVLGEGCTHTNNTVPCDDDSTCSVNDVCAAGLCRGQPVELSGCRQPTDGSQLRVRNRDDDDYDFLVWKWPKGEATTREAFGDPLLASGDYELCVFTGAPAQRALRIAARVPKSSQCGARPCWSLKGEKGYQYKNPAAPFGIKHVIFKSGADGEAKVVVKGNGPGLDLPGSLNLALPVRVQMKDSTTGECWEGTYGAPVQSDETRFKAKQ